MPTIDPAPFEASMPASVRALVARARRGEGPAAAWLEDDGTDFGQADVTSRIVRHPVGALTRTDGARMSLWKP